MKPDGKDVLNNVNTCQNQTNVPGKGLHPSPLRASYKAVLYLDSSSSNVSLCSFLIKCMSFKGSCHRCLILCSKCSASREKIFSWYSWKFPSPSQRHGNRLSWVVVTYWNQEPMLSGFKRCTSLYILDIGIIKLIHNVFQESRRCIEGTLLILL